MKLEKIDINSQCKSVWCVLSHAVDSININSIEKCSATAERGNGRGDHGLGKMPWHQPEHIYMYM